MSISVSMTLIAFSWQSSTFCCWLLISLLLGRSSSRNISIALLALVNADFFLAFFLFHSSICWLIFVATLPLVSLTAIFIILDISQVIPATCRNCILLNTPATLDLTALWSTTSLLSPPHIQDIVFQWCIHPLLPKCSEVNSEKKIPFLITQLIFIFHQVRWHRFALHPKPKWIFRKRYNFYIFFLLPKVL